MHLKIKVKLFLALFLTLSLGFNLTLVAQAVSKTPEAVLEGVSGYDLSSDNNPAPSIQPVEEIAPLGPPAVFTLGRDEDPEPAVGTITLDHVVATTEGYSADGTWEPRGNQCWNEGHGFKYQIKIVDASNDDYLLTTINPAPCNGDYSGDVSHDDRDQGGNWPANGQGGNEFTLTPGTHNVCAVLRHVSEHGQDEDRDCRNVEVPAPLCRTTLDYVDGQGGGADGKLTLGDAVVFTQRFTQSYNNAGGYDATVDATNDGKVDWSDYLCANKYYGNALAPACPLACDRPTYKFAASGEICDSRLDFNNGQGVKSPDGKLTVSDAVEYGNRYLKGYGKQQGQDGYDLAIDVDNNQVINGFDFQCASRYYADPNLNACNVNCDINACYNPLDFNNDFLITIGDGVNFSQYYAEQTQDESGHYKADLNGNDKVDYGDYLCSQDQLANATYQCPVKCAPVCGDGMTQRGEQCDNGTGTDGNGCSATCKIEKQCSAERADFNGDHKITLADAVTFTSLYATGDLGADLDDNSEVGTHDYNCMNDLLNAVTPEAVPPLPRLVTIAPTAVGISDLSTITAPEAPKVLSYNADLAETNFFVAGPLKNADSIQPAVVAPKSTTKNTTVAKVKKQEIKQEQVVTLTKPEAAQTVKQEAVKVKAQPVVQAEQPKVSVVEKVIKTIVKLFTW